MRTSDFNTAGVQDAVILGCNQNRSVFVAGDIICICVNHLVVGNAHLTRRSHICFKAQLVNHAHLVRECHVVGCAHNIIIGLCILSIRNDKGNRVVIAQNLIALYHRSVIDVDGQAHGVAYTFIRAVWVGNHSRVNRRTQTIDLLLSVQAQAARLVVQVPNITGFCAVVRQHLLGLLVQFHAPTGEELGQILAGHIAHNAGNTRVLGGCIAVCACLPLGKEFVIEVERAAAVQRVAVLIVSQMQLPVHAELYEYIASLTGFAACDLAENRRVHAFQTGRANQCAGRFRGLRNQRVNIVGNLSITDFIHVMSDFVRDAPTVQAIHIVAVVGVCGLGERVTGHHAACLGVVNAHICARRKHERAGEHAREADILTGLHGVLVGIDVRIGCDNALGLIGKENQFFPCADSLVKLIGHCIYVGLCAAQTGKHLVSRQRQQHARRCNLGCVACIGALYAVTGQVERGHIRLECLDIRTQHGFALGFALSIPLVRGQVEQRNRCDNRMVLAGVAHLQLDLCCVAALILDIQRAAALARTGIADLFKVNAVAAVVQCIILSGRTAFGILLPLYQRKAIALAQSFHIDRDRLIGQCGQAERLECRSRLTVFCIRRSAAGGKARTHGQFILAVFQKLLGVVQLIEHNGTVYIISVLCLCAGAQSRDGVSLYAALECGVAVVVEQCRNFVCQSVILIERDFRQADIARTVPLYALNGQ